MATHGKTLSETGENINPMFASIAPVWDWKNVALLEQANPVQNTWYEVLNITTYAKIYYIGYTVADTNETLEIELTINGKTETLTQAAIAGTVYKFFYGQSSVQLDHFVSATGTIGYMLNLEGRGILIRIRKTTAAGNGILSCAVKYQERDI